MRLPARHVLLLAPSYVSEGASQYFLRTVFGISQPTASRYVAFASAVLARILPTAYRVTRRLASAKREEFKQMVPGHGMGVLIIDCTHTERQRPTDKKERDASFGGKFKMHSHTTLFCTNEYGAILWMGRTLHGGTNDKGALNRNDPDFGKWTAEMRAKKSDPASRFTMIYDRGFPGVEGEYPAQRVPIGVKRGPGQDLTEE